MAQQGCTLAQQGRVLPPEAQATRGLRSSKKKQTTRGRLDRARNGSYGYIDSQPPSITGASAVELVTRQTAIQEVAGSNPVPAQS